MAFFILQVFNVLKSMAVMLERRCHLRPMNAKAPFGTEMPESAQLKRKSYAGADRTAIHLARHAVKCMLLCSSCLTGLQGLKLVKTYDDIRLHRQESRFSTAQLPGRGSLSSSSVRRVVILVTIRKASGKTANVFAGGRKLLARVPIVVLMVKR